MDFHELLDRAINTPSRINLTEKQIQDVRNLREAFVMTTTEIAEELNLDPVEVAKVRIRDKDF